MRKQFYISGGMSATAAIDTWVKNNITYSDELNMPSNIMSLSHYAKRRSNLIDCDVVPIEVRTNFVVFRIYATNSLGTVTSNYITEVDLEFRDQKRETYFITNTLNWITRITQYPGEFIIKHTYRLWNKYIKK